MDNVLKQEARNALVMGANRRMTAREHCERVRFDHNLVDKYVPNNKFRRIFPLDPGSGARAENGDDLDEFYNKLEKISTVIWKKQVGMIEKKKNDDKDPKQVKKKRRPFVPG